MNNIMGMLQAFNEFKQTFQGDPKTEIERLLQSGRISQQQLNQAQEMAKQLRAFSNNHVG